MSTTEQCALLDELSNSVLYQGVVAIKCALCLMGTIGICYQWSKQGSRFLTHENSKILFNFYYAQCVIITSMYTVAYLFELLRVIGDCGMCAAHFIVMALSIERLFSSFFPARFEKSSNRKLAYLEAVIVVSCSWIYMFARFSNNLSLLYDTPLVALFAEMIPENRANYEEVMTVISASSLLSFVFLGIDVYMNFVRKMSTNSSLSISYQRSENRRVILTILPIELMEAFLALIGVFTQVLQMKFTGVPSPVERIIIMELTSYSVLCPLTTAIIIEWRVSRRNRAVVTNELDDVDHFESMKRAWA